MPDFHWTTSCDLIGLVSYIKFCGLFNAKANLIEE